MLKNKGPNVRIDLKYRTGFKLLTYLKTFSFLNMFMLIVVYDVKFPYEKCLQKYEKINLFSLTNAGYFMAHVHNDFTYLSVEH